MRAAEGGENRLGHLEAGDAIAIDHVPAVGGASSTFGARALLRAPLPDGIDTAGAAPDTAMCSFLENLPVCARHRVTHRPIVLYER